MKTFRKAALLIFVFSLCLSALAACKSGNSGDGTSSDSTKKEYQKGTLTDTGFQSEYIGIKFTAPDGYIMATSEEIDSMIEFSAETIYADTDKRILDYAKATSVYEMMVQAPVGNPNALVMVEKLQLSGMTIDQYIEALKTQLTAADGMEFTFGTVADAQIAGKSFKKLPTVMDYSGMEMLQDYYLMKVDNRIVAVTVTYTEDTKAEMETLLAAFTAY